MFHLELMCINGEYSTALMKQTFRGDSKRSLYREFVTWESRNQALIKSSYLNHLSLFCSINPRITKILQNIIRPNFSFTQIHPGSDLILNSFRSIIPQNPVRFYKPIVFQQQSITFEVACHRYQTFSSRYTTFCSHVTLSPILPLTFTAITHAPTYCKKTTERRKPTNT